MHHKHCTQKEVFSCCGFTDNLLWGFTSGIRFISKHEMVNFESKNDFEATVLYFLYFFAGPGRDPTQRGWKEGRGQFIRIDNSQRLSEI